MRAALLDCVIALFGRCFCFLSVEFVRKDSGGGGVVKQVVAYVAEVRVV